MSTEELLHRASETHHMVWMKEDGDDPDWPMWYANWLIDHTNFVEQIGYSITKSELICRLMECDAEFTSKDRGDMNWEAFYAAKLEKA